jgi:hypothetical protein
VTTTIGTRQQIDDFAAALALYRATLQKLRYADERVADLPSRAVSGPPDYGTYPGTAPAATDALQRHVASLEAELLRLDTEVDVVLEFRLDVARAPYTAKRPNPPETLHVVRSTAVSAGGAAYAGSACGLGGLQRSGSFVPREDLWRLCKRCRQLMPDAEREALGEIDERYQKAGYGKEYDRGLYARHYRLNGRVY